MEKTNRTIEYFRSQIGRDQVQTPSPAGNWLGGVLRQIAFGSLEVAYLVRPEMLNPHKTLHGGIIGLMFDDAFGATVFCLERDSAFLTVSLHTEFLSVARLGDTVVLKTHVRRNGQTAINIDGELYLGDRLVATAGSILIAAAGGKKNDNDASA